jgi:hypothetical protein
LVRQPQSRHRKKRRNNTVLTSAECRMKAKEKLTLAARERDRRRAKRVMSSAVNKPI